MPVQPGNRPVVVGVDGSDSALDAATWAAREAHRHGVPLLVFTAFGWSEDVLAERRSAGARTRRVFLDAARSRLATAVTTARAAVPGLAVAGELVEDRPVPVLLAAGRDARLLVVGHRGLGGARWSGARLGGGCARAARPVPRGGGPRGGRRG